MRQTSPTRFLRAAFRAAFADNCFTSSAPVGSVLVCEAKREFQFAGSARAYQAGRIDGGSDFSEATGRNDLAGGANVKTASGLSILSAVEEIESLRPEDQVIS